MKINGNLVFHTLGDGEIRNAIIERITGTLPTGGQVAGRIAYHTDDNLYYFYNGTSWTPFSTGGDASALQTEVNNIEASLGSAMIDGADGTFLTAWAEGLSNVTGAASLAEVISQLDSAISGSNELAELNDVTLTSVTSGEVLTFTGTVWENQTLAEAGIQPSDTALTNLSALAGTGFVVQTGVDTFITTSLAASTVAGDQGISITDASGVGDAPTIGLDITGLTAEAGTPSATDVLAMFDGTNNVKVSITQLTAGIVADGIALGDLSDVTDAQTGTLTTGDKYFFNATGASAYEVTAATIGSLNNVASGVDAATTEDILAFDGTQWTAITVATMLADGSIGNLGDVTVTTPLDGDILYYSSGSPAGWVNGDPTTAGVQPYDAGLAALATGGTGVVSMDGDNVYFRTLTGTAGRIEITNGQGVVGNPTFDLATVSDSNTGTFEKITVDSYGRVTGTTPVVAGDITALVDGTYVNVSGDTMTGNLTMSSGTQVQNPTAPAGANDLTNKAYVDGLVASGTVWRDPVRDPDLVGVVSTEPGGPQAQSGYLTTTGGTWTGSVTVVAGDYVYWDGSAWTVVENIAAGQRLIIGGEHGTIESTLSNLGFRDGDLIEYVSGAYDSYASWTFPSDGGYNAIDFGTPKASGDATGLTTSSTYDLDVSINGVNHQLSVTGANIATYGGLATELNTALAAGSPIAGTVTLEAEGHFHVYSDDGSRVIVAAGTAGSGGGDLLAALSLTVNDNVLAGIENGTTVLVNDADSAHYGHTYLYTHELNTWTEISGPGSIGAGTGLYYTGTTLNIGLGAGIVELPTDEVGLDLYSPTGSALILTVDGTTRSTASGSKLQLLLDGSSLTQGTDGLAIAAGGITADMFASSVAGLGLSVNSSGSPLTYSLDVNVDDSTIEIVGDTLQVKDGGISNAKLANSAINTAAETGTGSVSLGGTLSILAGEGINTSDNGSGTITISGELASDANIGVASFNAADFLVTAGDVTIKTGGVSNTQLANSSITFAGDSGSSATSLGGTRTIAGGTGITTSESGGTITVSADSLTLADVTDVTADATESGQVLVAGTPTGSPATADYTPRHISYVHTQSSSSTTWTVSHSLGQKFVNVTVYDNTDNVIIPQSIVATDANTTTVTFNTAITGTVVVMGVAGSATGSA